MSLNTDLLFIKLTGFLLKIAHEISKYPYKMY